jgi:nucleosome binding factor SPN SPT16 subunit
MSITITKPFVFTEEVCINCGIAFFFPEDFKRERLKDHRSFFCPNGHQQYFSGETEAEKLRKELSAAKQREETIRQQRDIANAELAKEQAKVRLVKKRAAAGVCPCCKRTVSAMARHMKTKHPDFKP